MNSYLDRDVSWIETGSYSEYIDSISGSSLDVNGSVPNPSQADSVIIHAHSSNFSELGRKSVQVSALLQYIEIVDKDVVEDFDELEKRTAEDDGNEIAQILKTFNERTNIIKDARNELVAKHEVFTKKNEEIDNFIIAAEICKVHGSQFFQEVPKDLVKEFGLIQEFDVLPDLIRRYLDFRYNNEICNLRQRKEQITFDRERKRAKCARSLRIMPFRHGKQEEKCTNSLKVEPDKIVFHNYELGKVYKRTVKLLNIGTSLQSFSFKKLPKLKYFSIELENLGRIAPGMAKFLTVTFKPNIYRDVIEQVYLKNNQGQTARILMKCSRDSPKLLACLLKPNMHLLERSWPGTERFEEKRQKALNSTIDCGSCYVGQHVLMSLIIENVGMPAKFFIIQEEDWFFQDIETVSTQLELQASDFWIYPSYFEIGTNEMIEITIIFQPSKSGLQVETLYVICDNNSFTQIEIMGDSIDFSIENLKIDILPKDIDITKKENYIVYFGVVQNKTVREFRVSVHNNSCTYLKCMWIFTNKGNQLKGVHDLNKDCILPKTFNDELVPYSTTDFIFEIFCNGDVEGYYNIFFNFFILDIPEISLAEGEEFVSTPRQKNLGSSLGETLDILITSFEVACFIELPIIPKSKICVCDKCHQTPRTPKVIFTNSILSFGILPTGVNVKKEFFIESLTDEQVEWFIIELKYNLDSAPHAVILNKPNIDYNTGNFCSSHQKRSLFYEITTKKPCRWVSMLILATYAADFKRFEIESVCIVTYQLIHYEIVIHTGHSDSPIICPMKMLYKNIPEQIQIKVENFSPITGCFYFQNPIGNDKDKLSIEFHPQSSVLKPNKSVDVQVKLSCKETGTMENVYVPCFVGLGQDAIMLRILCIADDIHIIFYLPNTTNSFQKIMWPPKVIYEFDANPWYCPCEQEKCLHFQEPLEFGNVDAQFQSSTSDHLIEKFVMESVPELGASDSSNSSVTNVMGSLKEILQNKFGKVMNLQEVVEVRQLSANEPHTISFYIQNLTPAEAMYTVEVQNFNPTQDFDRASPQFILNKNDAWTTLVKSDYGILVHPTKDSGKISSYGWSKIDMTIFANTWGIYLEEIAVDIGDIQCYTFSLIIEIIGAPVFSIGRNTITEYPMIRLGIIPYNSESFTRRVELKNDSCIPMRIYWNSFLKTDSSPVDEQFSVAFHLSEWFINKADLQITNEYYGKNTTGFCKVIPENMIVEAKSSVFIDLVIQPSYFELDEKTKAITGFVVGNIYLEERYKLKPYYFYRDTHSATKRMKMQLDAILKMASLEVSRSCRNHQLKFHANQIILNKTFYLDDQLEFRNGELIPCKVKIVVPEPFNLVLNNKLKSSGTFTVEPGRSLVVNLTCYIGLEKLLLLSRLVYEDNLTEEDIKNITNNRYEVDKDKKVLKLFANGKTIVYKGRESDFTLGLCIYFPHISVLEDEVNFSSVFIGDTAKSCVCVYNNTGYKIKFEIYKSSTAGNFYVTPHYGDIAGNIGINKQFVYIFIYFTPTDCKLYHESFRIVTTIPNYFMEILLKGIGTNNGKFRVVQKI